MISSLWPEPILVARNLCKTYRANRWSRGRDYQALDEVNLALRFARTTALVGHSGSGKTTLAMCLAGLDRPDSGEIWFENCDLTCVTGWRLAQARTRIQIVFQDSADALSPLLSAREIVEEPLYLGGIPRPERQMVARDLLLHAGLAPDLEDRRPSQLSGGERQRLAIARAIAMEPQVLILDEPFTGLDLGVRGQIINLLLDLQEIYGLSYLYVSHELDVVRHFADEIAVLDHGRIVDGGSAQEVLATPLHPVTQDLVDSGNAIGGQRCRRQGEGRWHIC
jgi:ABC-type glutathione transport system ATPase component